MESSYGNSSDRTQTRNRQSGPRSRFMKTFPKYPYRMPLTRLALCVVLFGGASIYFLNEATHNEQGLIINGLITLDQGGANIFYWILALLSIGMTLFGIAGSIVCRVRPQFVELTDDYVVIPGNAFVGTPTNVQYTDIVDLEEYVVSRQRILNIYTKSKKHSIAAGMLPGSESFESIKAYLIGRIQP